MVTSPPFTTILVPFNPLLEIFPNSILPVLVSDPKYKVRDCEEVIELSNPLISNLFPEEADNVLDEPAAKFRDVIVASTSALRDKLASPKDTDGAVVDIVPSLKPHV